MSHQYEKKIEALEVKLKDLQDFKVEKAAEEKALKTQKKKLDRKEKSLREREAKVDLERVRIEKIKANENNEVAKPTNVEIKDENENESEIINCRHIPQCTTRLPYPPPCGPITLNQFELEVEIAKKEKEETKLDALIEDIMNFAHSEPKDDIDHTIAKITALKNLLEPNKEAHESQLEKLLVEANAAKEAIENLNKTDDYEDYFEDVDDGLPDYYWGGEDASELIFIDEDETES